VRATVSSALLSVKKNDMKPIAFILCAWLFIQSCSLKKEECSCIADYCADGFIYWGGPYEVDGIGWYFAEKREGNWRAAQLKEDEVPAAFKNFSDSTAVKICLRITSERAPCFCASPSYFHQIIKIEKR
jgi:hypothetical protein